jgi:hypothetical protein
VTELAADYPTVIRCLKKNGRLDRIPATPTVVAARRRPANNRAERVRLSDASAQLSSLCDGQRTVRELAERSSAADDGKRGKTVAPEQVCLVGVYVLRTQGLLVT